MIYYFQNNILNPERYLESILNIKNIKIKINKKNYSDNTVKIFLWNNNLLFKKAIKHKKRTYNLNIKEFSINNIAFISLKIPQKYDILSFI